MAEKLKSLTAIIYARVSSARQAEDGLPIASQLEQCREKARALGATVLREFADEGISGRTARARPEFLKAIAYCKEFKVGHFIVWSSSRFSRNKLDAANFKKALRSEGTKVSYVSSDIDPTTDDGWVMETVFEMTDELFSRTIAKDTKRSMLKNAADGYFNGGRVPYGYRAESVGKRRRLVIDEIEAPLVRRIFEAYLGGVGFRHIAITLNQDGFSKRGEAWNKKGIGLVLQNHRYVGLSIFNRRDHQERVWRDRELWVTAQSHEGIVSRETFDQVQNIIKSRAPASNVSSARSRWVFTGIARCGECGAKMKIETATGRSKTYSYYRCSSAIAGTGCVGFRYAARGVDKFLVGRIIAGVLRPDKVREQIESLRKNAGKYADERRETRELLVRELRDVEAKREKLFQVLEDQGADSPNYQDLMVRMGKHRGRIQQIEASLAELERLPSDADYLPEDVPLKLAKKAIATAIAEGAPDKKRLYFSSFIERVDFLPEGARVVWYPERAITVNPAASVHSEGRWLPDRSLLRTEVLELPLPPSLRRAA